jgi:hypothetical protein
MRRLCFLFLLVLGMLVLAYALAMVLLLRDQFEHHWRIAGQVATVGVALIVGAILVEPKTPDMRKGRGFEVKLTAQPVTEKKENDHG